ncbi:MAG: family 10 glycosylhydrolase [bacterium]|nr:family 10 glycosylhydrolase [bacterium]
MQTREIVSKIPPLYLAIIIIILTTFISLTYSGTPELRSLYIYSWGDGTFLNWTEVSTLVNTARTYHFNAIVPEVRKVGDAYYTSLYEPRANNPAVNDPDPTFDALSAMIKLAHDTSGGKKYIEVHAWLVANRIWKGSLSGAPAGHILLTHPEYMMYDSSGATSNSEGFYLDPGIPAVQEHQHNVFMDVVKRYDVDGVVLDYIRYPGNTWSYNTISIARFNKLYNRTGTPTTTDDQFDQFRRDNITALVKKLYANALEIKPKIKISICAIPWGYTTTDFYSSSAYLDVFQDWKLFMEGHFLDYLSPMIYDPDSNPTRAARYRNWNLACMNWSGGRHVYVLQGSYLNSITETYNQLYYSRYTAHTQGLQIYRYGYATKAGGSEDYQLYAYLTTTLFPDYVIPPDMPWKTSPTTGIIKGTVTYGNVGVDGALVMLSSGTTVYEITTTDATGFYAFFNVATSRKYTILADGTHWGYAYAKRSTMNESIMAGQIRNINFNLAYMNSYGAFTVSSDTSRWYFATYGDAISPGILSWGNTFSGQSGIVILTQTGGQKGKLTQIFSVPSSGWYTAIARVATDVTDANKRQKVYLYLQELDNSSTIVATGNVVVQPGNGGFSIASSWRELAISFYAQNTLLAVQFVGINPANSGITSRLYLDYIWVLDGTILPSTPVVINNSSFDAGTTGWMVDIYGDGTGLGSWSQVSSWFGRTGVLKGTQSGGEKAKLSQLFAFANAGYLASGSVWLYSGAGNINDSQKVYLYLYSYDSGYKKIIESGNAVLQPGKWAPNQWRQLQFVYPPLTRYNAVQVVGINPSGNPTQTMYFDTVELNQN